MVQKLQPFIFTWNVVIPTGRDRLHVAVRLLLAGVTLWRVLFEKVSTSKNNMAAQCQRQCLVICPSIHTPPPLFISLFLCLFVYFC